jgi:hypothetical protein
VVKRGMKNKNEENELFAHDPDYVLVLDEDEE